MSNTANVAGQSVGQVTGDRERVLASIRQAMATPTDPHVMHGNTSPDRSRYADVLPPVADTWEAKLAALTERCTKLTTTLIVVPNREAMRAAVAKIIEEGKADAASESRPGVVYQRNELVGPIAESVAASFDVPRVCVDDLFDIAAVERCGVGISGCFALVAQTGSVVVTSSTTGGRALTVLPPHHIVLATADQLWTNLPTMYDRFAASPDRQGSMISIISGPSRTGDIERILVLGAHGPKRLTIVLQAPEA